MVTKAHWTGVRILRLSAKIIAVLILLASLLLAAYLYYLDGIITKVFEGRRWTIPATVYAQPIELHPGSTLNMDALLVELDRLGYRQKAHTREPGIFKVTANKLDIYLRSFEFSDGPRAAQKISLSFDSNQIASIYNQLDEEVFLIRLEPLVIGSFFPSHGEDRMVISPNETPELLTSALKAVEDQKFDHHPGFDIFGIARAMWVNLSEGEFKQGGSTLTQQLVKSYFLSNRRTLERKFKELCMAVILEARFEKEDLLNAYVNEIYLGQDGSRAIHGFGLGAQFYFAKPLNELSAEEIAFLVAVIRGPTYYDPRRHSERALARRNSVLNIMFANQLIEKEILEEALTTPLGTFAAKRTKQYHPAFMDLVRAQLQESYDADALATEGLRVFTTLDPAIQQDAEEAVEEILTQIETAKNLPPQTLQSAVVVATTHSADVVAIVGGRSSAFNRAVKTKRHVGSLIKPAVYMHALETGDYHLVSRLQDEPVVLTKPQWEPQNFDGKSRGDIPLYRALAESLNLATVHLGLSLGVENIAKRVGELTHLPAPNPYPSLLLGAVELSPMDVSRMYNNFASGGFSAPHKSVIAVIDAEGDALKRFPIEITNSISPDVAIQITTALQVVMHDGTGRRSQFSKSGLAGKTGTSDDYRDSWFAGYDDQYLTVIWVGRDDYQPSGLTGSSGALRIFDTLMQDQVIRPPLLFSNTLVNTDIDYETGTRSHPRCGKTVTLPLPDAAQVQKLRGCPIRLHKRRDRKQLQTQKREPWFQN